MKTPLLCLLALMVCAQAAEPVKFPMEVGKLTLQDGKVYEGVKITGQDASGVKIMHSGGTARVSFDRLPAELAARFPREPEAAKKPPTPATTTPKKPDAKKTDRPKVPAGPTAEEKAKAEQIAALETANKRLEQGVAQAKAEIENLKGKATDMRSRATKTVQVQNANGGSSSRQVTDRSKMNRAETYEKQAEKEQEKIRKAELLIGENRGKIEQLKRAK